MTLTIKNATIKQEALGCLDNYFLLPLLQELPLVRKTCNTLLHVTFLLGRIPKPHRPFLYNEFLIVVWSKVLWSKEEAEKKGPSLAYRFQRSMESGDASDKEVPLVTPKATIQ